MSARPERSFGSARLAAANMILGKFDRANFEGVDLTAAQLVDAILVGADLRSAQIEDADFSAANLSEAIMQGAEPCRLTACRRLPCAARFVAVQPRGR